MITKQTIAIIGATGKMGSAITRKLAKGNYRLLIFGKREAALQELHATITRDYPFADIEPITCSYAASWEADIILLAVPYAAEKEIAEKIREVANQKIVISISSAAEELQHLLPHSKLVNASNIFSTDEVSLSGNDAEALTIVAELFETSIVQSI
jgi:8-hydroxy-5-deazaflavin:NADPH oxidoreductase